LRDNLGAALGDLCRGRDAVSVVLCSLEHGQQRPSEGVEQCLQLILGGAIGDGLARADDKQVTGRQPPEDGLPGTNRLAHGRSEGDQPYDILGPFVSSLQVKAPACGEERPVVVEAERGSWHIAGKSAELIGGDKGHVTPARPREHAVSRRDGGYQRDVVGVVLGLYAEDSICIVLRRSAQPSAWHEKGRYGAVP
jgi:hypothetical protein